MTRWAPAKNDVLAALATEILHNYGRGRTAVAIDGDDPAVSGAFAEDLAAAVRLQGHDAFTAHLVDFRRPRADRDDQAVPEDEREYRLGYDYDLLRRILLDPFKLGGSTGFVLRGYDSDRDAPRAPRWRTGARDAVLFVDGPFALRPELRGAWNDSVRLDTQEPVVDPAYRRATDARAAAVILVDIRDPDNPRRIFADAC